MSDLYTWLTARYVEEHSAGNSAAASDAALQWMELQLEASHETGGDERYLLEQYLRFSNDELQTLPGQVHQWFLERWALAGPNKDDIDRTPELAERIATMYLIAGPGTHQAAVVAALLAFDRQQPEGVSSATRIWDIVNRSFGDNDRAAALAPLIEALLDLAYMTVENGVVLRALGDIARRDVQTRYALPLIRERVAMVREDPDGIMSRLLTEFEE